MKSKLKGLLPSMLIVCGLMVCGLGLMTGVAEAAAIKGGLLDIQRDVGEYFRPDDNPENFKFMAEAKVPSQIVSVAAAKLEDYLGNQGENTEYRFTAEIWDYYQVFDETGLLVGYVVEIVDSIDHPLWDGSGLNVWMDVDGTIVAEVPWAG